MCVPFIRITAYWPLSVAAGAFRAAVRRDRRVITDEIHADLVVNLAEVNFIDSAGVGVLVGIWHRVRATNRGLALAAPSGHARRILKTTGLAKAFGIYDIEAAAVEACRPPAAG